ncbi:hypothetical protein [Brochothrix campestris]|uniref:Uncharacterized protein n=1 Tax=Brochothrix campestris FSL F6-1037 TaxID=1265861 RepID=W7DAD0_9LIST|nr:hypothetical protein [Brochothrix campestris]EUJ42218.1 hypothetical protein BCAMP_00445 [Brochothrix campestris FSL F6-1037]
MKTWKVEIEELQQQILNQINPVLLSNTAIMKLENWFSSHPTVHKYSQDNNLIFSNTTDKANYISLLEKNTYFKSFPQELIPVLENEHIHLHFDAEVIGKASVHIAIIEYSHVEKRTSTLYSIQAPITHTLSDMTKEIRIAMKISGKGMVILKKGEIKRIDQVNKNKDISKAAPQQLLKKSNKNQ